jgi:hypothetical protein
VSHLVVAIRHVDDDEVDEEEPMQFVLLIYQGSTPLPNTAAWSELAKDEQRAIYADYAALNNDPRVESGPPLGLPEQATTVRVDHGTTSTSDGPYLGADGAVGGFMVFEADDLDAAVELAARVPAARHGGAVEVRPVATYW